MTHTEGSTLRQIPQSTLLAIQGHFHAVILDRTCEAGLDPGSSLPRLAPLLDSEHPEAWFPVPGWCGGFRYWLEGDGVGVRLVCESWSRIVGGSGMRHEITSEGSRVVEMGFV